MEGIDTFEDQELKEAYEKIKDEENSIENGFSIVATDIAGNIIHKFIEKTKDKDPKYRLFDVDENGEFDCKWISENYSIIVPIYDTVFNVKGSLIVRYFPDADGYAFRIDDTRIAESISGGRLPLCLFYEKDKEDTLYFEKAEEDSIEKYLDEYIDIIFEKEIDRIVVSLEDIDKQIEEIKNDMVTFCNKLHFKKPLVDFRCLLYNYIDKYTGKIDVLVKLVLWPEKPCPISQKDDSMNENKERFELVKDIEDYFYGFYVIKYLKPDSVIKRLVQDSQVAFLNVEFRPEEKKMPSMLKENLEEDKVYMIYDTNLKMDEVGEISKEILWRKNVEYELSILGKFLAEEYKNLMDIKIAFKKNRIINKKEIDQYIATIFYVFRNGFSKSIEYIEQDMFSKCLYKISNDKNLSTLNDTFGEAEDDNDMKYLISFKNKERIESLGTDEDYTDAYVVFEYKCKIN